MKRKQTKPSKKRSDGGKVPSGETITEYLAQKGLKRGVELEEGEVPKAGEVLQVGGGGKYQMGRVLGEGGMGVVHKARDMNCRRTVAMKVLRENESCSSEDLLRFIEEAQITSQLEHPSIVPVHELGLDAQGNVFYTMKLLKGDTLTQVLVSLREADAATIENYPLSRLLNIFQKVCDAVAFAHSKGVIHRDLKPDNIMIGDYGEVQIMDWGLAKILARLSEQVEGATEGGEVPAAGDAAADTSRDEEPPGAAMETWGDDISSLRMDEIGTGLKTMSGRVMGSPGFMAPEQIDPDANIDERADVYSLGAVLYSILALRSSVKGETVKEVLRKIVTGDIAAPMTLNEPGPDETRSVAGGKGDECIRFVHCPGGQIPQMLSDIAMKAMAVDPEDRYPSVQALQQDVEAFQEGLIWHLIVDDDFSGPELPSHWQVLGGQYEIKDGELRVYGGEPQLVLLRQDVPGDVRIEFECHMESVYLNDMGCLIGAARSDNYKEIPSTGYEFKCGAFDNSVNMLTRSNNRLWSKAVSQLERSRVFHVCAERIGSRLRMTIDDEEIFLVVDPDPISGADHVVVGLLGWMAETWYSRVRIYSLGTPWRADILDVAERQMQKGRYDLAMGLFEEVMESFPDAERMERAQEGYYLAEHRDNVAKKLPAWKEALERAWPGATPEVRITNDGLSVEISNFDIRDLSPLHGLPITSLYCSYCNITSLEPLRGMPLTTLNCTGNPITDLSPLAGMPLFTLLCEDCPITSLEPLRNMPLNMLLLSVCDVESLEPLRGIDLSFFSFADSKVEDLEPLRGLPLMFLNFAGNRVSSLDPLKDMQLNTLHCGGNRVKDLGPLRGMPLTVLHLGDSEVEDLEPLTGMPLTILSAHCNRIKSLEPLRDTSLSAITCGGNPLAGIGPFLKKPPEDFLFDCDSISTDELKWIHKNWTRDFRFLDYARNVEVLLALREGGVEKLRSLASEFEGHRYLFLPKFLRWEEAREFCEELGGHLVTITSQAENDFVSSLFKGGCWFWIGLMTTREGQEWVTGEPFDYHTFVDDLQKNKVGPKVFCRKWFSDHLPHAHNTFMIEWDS